MTAVITICPGGHPAFRGVHWREHLDRRRETVATYGFGLIRLPIGRFIDPLFGFNDAAVEGLSQENPIEHLDRYGIKNGDLAMYLVYVGRDEFNIDSQAESFLYRARELGICVDSDYDRWGHHNSRTAFRLMPATLDWLGRKLGAYGPTPRCAAADPKLVRATSEAASPWSNRRM